MNFGPFTFGALEIDGKTYTEDVVIDHGSVRERQKSASRKYRNKFGHTPLSIEEDLPWQCSLLVIGTGMYGSMPVMQEIKIEAERRHVTLSIAPTGKALQLLQNKPMANAILHITC